MDKILCLKRLAIYDGFLLSIFYLHRKSSGLITVLVSTPGTVRPGLHVHLNISTLHVLHTYIGSVYLQTEYAALLS